MLKIERLIYAMAEQEGWIPLSSSPIYNGSRSYRHHNPGNLRSSPFEIGKKDGFSIFNTDIDGFSAFKWDIIQKAKGNTITGLNGESTLTDLIYKWAPSSDNNDPNSYLRGVMARTGYSPTMRLKEFLN
jgi:hypothetical protein